MRRRPAAGSLARLSMRVELVEVPARAELPAAARRQAEWVLLMLGRLMSGSVRLMSGRHQACAAAAHERWAYVSLGLVETRRKGGLSESPPTRTLDAGPSVCLL